jgi:hypothetical protein
MPGASGELSPDPTCVHEHPLEEEPPGPAPLPVVASMSTGPASSGVNPPELDPLPPPEPLLPKPLSSEIEPELDPEPPPELEPELDPEPPPELDPEPPPELDPEPLSVPASSDTMIGPASSTPARSAAFGVPRPVGPSHPGAALQSIVLVQVPLGSLLPVVTSLKSPDLA